MSTPRFDCVVMLTWSDWKTEPRSNRYHYASRFARSVPVFFVQPDEAASLVEPTEVTGVALVHSGPRHDAQQLAPVARLLAERGLSRPLLWIYSPRYTALERHFPGALRVLHATEDYFSGSTFLQQPAGPRRFAQRREVMRIQRQMIQAAQVAHLVVCVSPGVAEGIVRYCAYRGELRVLENGCDYAFWAEQGGAPAGEKPVAIYQGGINERLDTQLIVEVMRRLPEWEFRFCGSVSAAYEGWRELQRAPNFRNLGTLTAEALRDELHRAHVGIMPYRQVRSLTGTIKPLKAFEFAACGLPVVSVPIESLANFTEVFRFATSAEAFAQAIREEAALRDDPRRRDARLAAARAQDYDSRFRELEECLHTLRVARSGGTRGWMRICALAAGELWNRALYRISASL